MPFNLSGMSIILKNLNTYLKKLLHAQIDKITKFLPALEMFIKIQQDAYIINLSRSTGQTTFKIGNYTRTTKVY